MIETMTDTALRPGRPKKQTSDKAPSGKQRVIDAAERLFANKGFLEVSAAEIAREAGVAHGLLFHHFGSMEELYAEVSRVAAQRMDEIQLASFRGKTARDQMASFLRAHMKAIGQRQGDSLFRARSHSFAIHGTVAEIWEASRYRAIDHICVVLGLDNPSKRVRTCLRAWIGFHDQLVLAWLTDQSITEDEVLEWTLRQLDQLAVDVLSVDLQRKVLSK
jgi:AcrR family transcriptional regulator